jgi:hypothetical protein
MSYLIASEKLGVIGDLYVPKAGINVAALLAGGFITELAEVSTTEEEKPAKPKYKKAPKE